MEILVNPENDLYSETDIEEEFEEEEEEEEEEDKGVESNREMQMRKK